MCLCACVQLRACVRHACAVNNGKLESVRVKRGGHGGIKGVSAVTQGHRAVPTLAWPEDTFSRRHCGW